MKRVLNSQHLEVILDALGRRPADPATKEAFEILVAFLGAHKKGRNGATAPRAVLLTKFEAKSLSRAAGNSLDSHMDALDILGSPAAVEAARFADDAITDAGFSES